MWGERASFGLWHQVMPNENIRMKINHDSNNIKVNGLAVVTRFFYGLRNCIWVRLSRARLWSTLIDVVFVHFLFSFNFIINETVLVETRVLKCNMIQNFLFLLLFICETSINCVCISVHFCFLETSINGSIFRSKWLLHVTRWGCLFGCQIYIQIDDKSQNDGPGRWSRCWLYLHKQRQFWNVFAGIVAGEKLPRWSLHEKWTLKRMGGWIQRFTGQFDTIWKFAFQ